MAKGTELTEAKTTALSTDVSSFEEFAGLGTENIRAEDQTIPRLSILESLSPEVNKRDGAYIQGAEAGMILDKINGEVIDGDAGIVVIPCYFRTYLAEWRPKAAGGGYVGEYDIDDPIRKRVTRNAQNADVLPNGNELVDTAEFFVIVIHPTEGPQQRLITMTKTKLKKARKWNTLIMSQLEKGASGNLFKLPMMAVKYRLRTVPESNEKGSWFNWEPSKIERIDLSNADEKFIFDMGVAFAKAVGAGEVKVSRTRDDEPEPSHERDGDIPF